MKILFNFLLTTGLILVTFFTLNSCKQQNPANQKAEQEAIKKVIRDQTRLVIEGDFQKYQQVWAHQPYAERMLTNQRVVGWNQVSEVYRNLFENLPEFVPLNQREFSDFNFRIYDNVALVSNAQHHKGTPSQYNIRLLEKEGGDWKIVYHNTLPYRGEVGSISGSELWDKVIDYHDPEDNWTDFRGKVQIITTFENGNQGKEILEVRKPDNFYQSIRIAGDNRAVKGVKKGECFQKFNGNTNPSKAIINKYNIDCEGAHMFKELHTCHFGLPMALKNSGVEVQEQVEMTNFQSQSAYALRFSGNPDEVIHNYYAGSWTLYVDPESFALLGMRTDLDYQGETINYLTIFKGELKVGGIIMPQVKVGYRNGDFWHNDAFILPPETLEQ